MLYGDKAYNESFTEDILAEACDIKLLPHRKKNSKRSVPPYVEYVQQLYRKKIETGFSGMSRLLPKSIGSCWIESEAGVHQHSKKPSGHLLEVVFPLEDGDVLGQMLLVNPAKAAQKISQSCPDSFYGIAVDLLQAISVGVPCPFPLRMID